MSQAGQLLALPVGQGSLPYRKDGIPPYREGAGKSALPAP